MISLDLPKKIEGFRPFVIRDNATGQLWQFRNGFVAMFPTIEDAKEYIETFGDAHFDGWAIALWEGRVKQSVMPPEPN